MKVFKLFLFLITCAAMIGIVIFLMSDKNEQNNELVDGTNQEENIPNNDSSINNGEEDDNVSNTDGNDDTNGSGQEEPVPSPTSSPTDNVDTDAESVAVMVNPNYKLPEDYSPKDLVYPDVRFTFDDKIEKRMMRQAAATALEEMFEAAEVDGIYLAGVSAYRSHETQKALFKRYVERDGYEKAKTYSAEPGTSEHETGLAIDVSGSTGKCAAEDCFGGTVEAIWLANNAANHGFIIRYPEGKEDITGYKYEPWHLRYVGVEIAKEIDSEGLTLEEYYQVVPVKR
ncbi:MAG: M15 family metallopeptidase [Candidatus Pristimantibacillus lignocellulolyticus]|uniref:M15 family metallopeptidase n=1 Tax=Candidatus Pristimantibacillus lignocellulolyticus TaxID=2994561 RepID=A0A9J6ZHN7_9BACL|nr:MAG: M15 family metallopeptidase [Candidatus Pristimantibacillus lignocellulolyticus]